MEFRTGIAFDVHSFSKDRKLVLGGVEIESEFGLAGHSDADVLLHAICDALLGAAALGDIGIHFPNTDPAYKNIDSLVLLGKVEALVNAAGYSVGNIDSMLALEKPKISPYIPEMKKRISSILNINENRVSVKATTAEKLGFVGRQEGAAAFATVLLIKNKND